MLTQATPIDTGEAASSWSYSVNKVGSKEYMTFYNSKMADTVPIVVLLQYGHMDRSGQWVQARHLYDHVIFDLKSQIRDLIKREVDELGQ